MKSKVPEEIYKETKLKYRKLFEHKDDEYYNKTLDVFFYLKGFDADEDLKNEVEQKLQQLELDEFIKKYSLPDIILIDIARAIVDTPWITIVKREIHRYAGIMNGVGKLASLIGIDVGYVNVRLEDLQEILDVASDVISRYMKDEKSFLNGYDYFDITQDFMSATKSEKALSTIDNDLLINKLLRGFISTKMRKSVNTTQYILVDRSGSMFNFLAKAKGIAVGLASIALREGKEVMIGTFSTSLDGIFRIKNKEKLKEFIKVAVGGGTDINKPLTQFIKQIKNNTRSKEVIVITDAQFNINDELIREIRSKRVRTKFVLFLEPKDDFRTFVKNVGGEYVVYKKTI